MNMEMRLVTPTIGLMDSYKAALATGWSPNTVRPEASQEELSEIAKDPIIFLQKFTDLEGAGPPVKLPDGSLVKRIPGFSKWLWDGEFSGVISFRWSPGTENLPAHVLGHIGYSVVPWKQGNGYATKALSELLSQIAFTRLRYIDVTTDVENRASQRVAEKCGAIFHEEFEKPAVYGSTRCLRYRIHLQ